VLMKAGLDQTQTAHVLGVHKSTISRELRWNCGLRVYRPKQAGQFAEPRRQRKAQPRLTTEHRALDEQLFRQDWSPEQFSLWLRQEKHLLISHAGICQYVSKGSDFTDLY